MKYFNKMYRAFNSYRLETKKDKNCINGRIEIKQSNVNLDFLSSKKLNITIEEDWISKIEDGIRHISEAVAQERQFIRTNGDVVPIEKVKRVSRASIVHLARHSELITKMPKEGEILTPDKVYMEEKLSDFTVYENRFLYTLLVYLQQFVNMRLEKINEVIRTYEGNLTLNKNIENKTHNMSFELTFKEERFDVFNNNISENTLNLIDRLEMISRGIISLLSCNLMKEVSKAPLVKPPLVKTNVLKGNKNFKAAVILYDFINAYNEDGYVVEEIIENFDFNTEIADEYAELVSLTSFLTYKFGNNLTAKLKNDFDEEELEIKEKENIALRDKISRIKYKIEELGMSIEEYVLLLERRNTILEEENLEIVVYKEQINSFRGSIAELKDDLAQANNTIDSLTKTVETKNKEIISFNQTLEEKEKEAVLNYKNHIEDLSEARNDAKRELETYFIDRQKTIEYDFKAKYQLLVEEKEVKSKQIRELEEKNLQLEKERDFIYAQLLAIRVQNDCLTKEDDYSSKERFKELEGQFFALESFFDEEWKRAKKKLRKQYLSNK